MQTADTSQPLTQSVLHMVAQPGWNGQAFQAFEPKRFEHGDQGDRHHSSQAEQGEGPGCMRQPSGPRRKRNQNYRADRYQDDAIHYPFRQGRGQNKSLAQAGLPAHHERPHHFAGTRWKQIISEISRGGGPERQRNRNLTFGAQQHPPAHGANEQRERYRSERKRDELEPRTPHNGPDLRPLDTSKRVIQEDAGERESNDPINRAPRLRRVLTLLSHSMDPNKTP